MVGALIKNWDDKRNLENEKDVEFDMISDTFIQVEVVNLGTMEKVRVGKFNFDHSSPWVENGLLWPEEQIQGERVCEAVPALQVR